MSQVHPRRGEAGNSITIDKPNIATSMATWHESTSIATAVPGQSMPEAINGGVVRSWHDSPEDPAGWERRAEGFSFVEPEFLAEGMQSASGAVVLESDGRVWVVSPTNRFGGYENTFPKGKLGGGDRISMRANALKEVFEESGLEVELIAFLVDAIRSTSKTRYYLARRLGGNPADMGWESQAVHLVPGASLKSFMTNKNDGPVLGALAVVTSA